jgi:diaminopimelate epimerase
MMHFVKYHGTGNDFIIVDDRITRMDLNKDEIKFLCDRHFGIGADGLILMREKDGFDFEMLYYNSDGLPGSMCGNGGRCSVAFAHSLKLVNNRADFIAFDGPHEALINSVNPYEIKLHMSDVDSVEKKDDFIYMNTGSPHYVTFINDLEKLDIVSEGRKIRFNERFKKEGTNVNFVRIDGDRLHIRTYERGVEDETLSCGTGVTASVLGASLISENIKSGCKVQTPGGILRVYFINKEMHFSEVWLEGGVTEVFRGEINLKL